MEDNASKYNFPTYLSQAKMSDRNSYLQTNIKTCENLSVTALNLSSSGRGDTASFFSKTNR